ncbi:hypothetical protein D3C76_360620 [compost metagenome]
MVIHGHVWQRLIVLLADRRSTAVSLHAGDLETTGVELGIYAVAAYHGDAGQFIQRLFHVGDALILDVLPGQHRDRLGNLTQRHGSFTPNRYSACGVGTGIFCRQSKALALDDGRPQLQGLVADLDFFDQKDVTVETRLQSASTEQTLNPFTGAELPAQSLALLPLQYLAGHHQPQTCLVGKTRQSLVQRTWSNVKGVERALSAFGRLRRSSHGKGGNGGNGEAQGCPANQVLHVSPLAEISEIKITLDRKRRQAAKSRQRDSKKFSARHTHPGVVAFDDGQPGQLANPHRERALQQLQLCRQVIGADDAGHRQLAQLCVADPDQP